MSRQKFARRHSLFASARSGSVFGIFLFLVLSFAQACGGAPAQWKDVWEHTPGQRQSKPGAASPGAGIVGGSLLSAASVGAWSTVALANISAGGVCTGTLIADDLVVTAGHCLHNHGMTHVLFGDSVFSPTAARPIVEGKTLLQDLRMYPNFDVAWVRFEGGLPEGYRPARILPDASALRSGLPLVLVGYGKTGDGQGASSGHRLTVESIVGEFLNDGAYRNLILVGPYAGRGNCFGDSGGPAYAQVDGELVLVSSLSGFARGLTPELTCTSGHVVHNFLGAYKEWISTSAGVTLP